MSSDSVLVLCAYLTPDMLALPGNKPVKCGMCETALVISAPAQKLLTEHDGRPVCAGCMAANAPEGNAATPMAAITELAKAMGVSEEFIAEMNARPIKEVAAVLAAHHRSTSLN